MNAIDRGGDFMRRRLELALEQGGGTHTFDEAMQRVAERRAQLWVADDQRGAIVTELLIYPQFKTVNYWLVAGALDSVLGLQGRIEDFGREQGCRHVAAMGRGGWARVLPAFGWTVAGTAYKKDIAP